MSFGSSGPSVHVGFFAYTDADSALVDTIRADATVASMITCVPGLQTAFYPAGQGMDATLFDNAATTAVAAAATRLLAEAAAARAVQGRKMLNALRSGGTVTLVINPADAADMAMLARLRALPAWTQTHFAIGLHSSGRSAVVCTSIKIDMRWPKFVELLEEAVADGGYDA